MNTEPLSQLVEMSNFGSNANDALFYVAARQRARRHRVSIVPLHETAFSVSARANAKIGDAPNLIHPLYLAAIVATKSGEVLPDLDVPVIEFSTDEATRRSMTLNGMRMSTEFFANGSTRVLELIENRLEAGQRDVVHNVLVYLMRRVFDIQADAEETRDLRAEALAAFLGLEQNRVRILLSRLRPTASRVAQSILSGEAGTVRRRISDDDLMSLVQNQLQILGPQLRGFAREEEHVLRLVDEVVMRLRNV